MGEPAGETDKPRLGGDHVSAVLGAGVRAQAPNVDDRAGAAALEVRQAGLGAIEGAFEDDAHDLAPFGERHLVERLLPPQRRIVDETVDAAEALGRRRRHFLHGDRIGDIADAGDGLAASVFDRAHHGVGLRAIGSRIDDDRRAAGCQFERDRAPDVAPGAGDDGDAAGEFVIRSHQLFS